MAASEKRTIVIDVDGRSGEISADRLDKALARIDRTLNPLSVATRKFQSELSYLNAAQQAGLRTADQTARSIATLTTRYDEQRRKLEQVSRAQVDANRATSQGGVSDTGRSLESQGTAIAGLTTKALAAAAAVAAVVYSVKSFATTIAEAGDEIRVLNARLNVLADNSKGSRSALDAVVRTAQSVGVEIKDVGQVFAGLTLASKDLGATSNDIQKVATTILQLGRIGGASQQELVSGSLQLRQALASGKLAGDELRSVLENMPLVARAIAKEFNVSVGELRKLGEEGRLTSDRVFRALINAGEDANRQFRELPPTLEQAGTRGANAFKLLWAAIDDSLGVSKLLAEGLTATADRATALAKRISGDINVALADTIQKLAQLDARAKAAAADAEKRAQIPGTAPPRADYGGRPLTTAEQYAIRKGQVAPRATSDELERARLEQQKREQEAQAAEEAYRKMAEYEGELQRAAEAAAAAARKRAEDAQKAVDKIVQSYDEQAARAAKVAEKEKELKSAVEAKAITQAQADAILKRYAASLDKSGAAAQREENAHEKAQKRLDDFIKALTREADGLNETERERVGNNAALKAEELARDKALKLTEDQVTAYGAEAKAMAQTAYDRKQANEAAKKAQEDAEREIKQQAERNAEAAAEPWRNATESLQSYIVEGLTGGFRNAREAIIGIWRRLMAELAVATVIRPIILQPVVSLLGGAGLVSPAVASAYGGGIGGGGGGLGSILGLGGSSPTGSIFGTGLSDFLNTPLTGSFAGISPSSMAGVIPGMSGAETLSYFSQLPGMGWNVTPGGLLGGIAGIGMGVYGLASGNTIGGISGLLGGGLSLAAMAPGLGFLGPIGMGIGLIGGILGSLFGKKKVKTPQEVSNIYFGPDGITNAIGYSRGKSLGSTGPAAGAFGTAFTDLLDAYGLSTGPGFQGGWILNSIGKNTGNQWIVGTGAYNPGDSSRTIKAGLGSAEDAINVLAAALFKAGAASGTLQGLSVTQQRAINSTDLTSIDEIKKALDFSDVYDEIIRGTDNITAAEKAVKDLNDQFRSLTSQAKQYGLEVGVLDTKRQEAINKLATDANDEIWRRALGMTPEGQLQLALEDFDKARDAWIKNAEYINTVVTGTLVDIAAAEDQFGKERLAIIENANKAANDSLETLWRRLTYGDLSGASPLGTLEGTQSAYQVALAAAQGGDLTARANLASLAEDFVRAGYLYQGSNAAQGALVSGVASDIAPFFTANGNLGAVSDAIAQSVSSYNNIWAEQQQTIARLIEELRLERETNQQLIERISRLL